MEMVRQVLLHIQWDVKTTISLATALLGVLGYLYNRRSNSNRSRQEYNSQVRGWANCALLALSDAIHLCDGMSVDETELRAVRARLSAQIDAGRLFFPNARPDEYGATKSDAFRGYRPRILSWLVCGYRMAALIETAELRPAVRHHLAEMKREFTTDTQMLLDPLRLFGTIGQLKKLLLRGAFMDGSERHRRLVEAAAFIDSAQTNSALSTAAGKA